MLAVIYFVCIAIPNVRVHTNLMLTVHLNESSSTRRKPNHSREGERDGV